MSTILMIVLLVVLFLLFEKYLLNRAVHHILRLRLMQNSLNAKWVCRSLAALVLVILLF